MRDQVAALISARAAELAAIDGVAVAVRHVHGAAADVTALVQQARDHCLRQVPQAGAEVRPRVKTAAAQTTPAVGSPPDPGKEAPVVTKEPEPKP